MQTARGPGALRQPMGRAAAYLAAPPPDVEAPWQRERARRVSLASLGLFLVWGAAAVAVPALQPTALREGPMVLTGLLVAAPVASGLAYLLSRSRFTLSAATACAAVAAAGTLVVTGYQPGLALPVSVTFLFASLLLLGCLFLPLGHAAAIAGVNAFLAAAGAELLPQAGGAALHVPYLFLVVNGVGFAILAPLRQRDQAAARREGERAAAAAESLRRLQEHADVLRSAGESKDQALRTASHEVRTPLTVILLQLALLRKGSRAAFTPEQERSVLTLDRNLKRLASLLEDLLDKALLDAGRLPLHPRPVRLDELAQEVGEMFQETAAESGIRLQVETAPAPAWGDPARITQVLVNLVGNALKFTPSGGTVRLRAGPDGEGGAAAEVADDGPGLTPEQARTLFQPFCQVHPPQPGRPRGAGLGLAICLGIVERHGGRIWAESDGPGRGCRFRVQLPARGPAEAGGPTRTSA